MLRRILIAIPFVVAAASAQPGARRATNLAALIAHPGFYHLRPVLIVGKVSRNPNGELRMTDEAGSLRILFKGSAHEVLSEIRGDFWDIGRMNSTDPQLAPYDLKATFHVDPDGPWPRPGQVTAIVATTITEASQPPAPSIRAMVLFPSRYLDQKVTVTGQFAGRNLQGDLPDAPGKSRYDFVVRSVDAAVWVINLRPRGKDFDLSLDTRIDTGRWLEVSGTVQQGRGLMLIDAQTGSVKIAKPPTEASTTEPVVRAPPAPPPEVIFSAPTSDETDVVPSTNVRIQFSRNIDAATIRGRVRVTYAETGSAAGAQPPAPTPDFTTQYNAGNRVLEVRFPTPLERFRTVRIELLEGILGADRQPLRPWNLTFQTGGN